MSTVWSVGRINEWWHRAGWVFGCNFTPSTAGNQIEFWSANTFDLDVIDRELGYAASLGMNTVRVYLHNLLWEHETTDFLSRIDTFLGVAASHRIRVMPVLFDGVWNPEPRWGSQPDPVPGVHNSIWVQAPGAAVMHDPTSWSSLVPYVENVMAQFADDPRVLAWDLFNEPDQLDLNTIVAGSRDAKSEAATALVREVFAWARGAKPSQPLTVGLWEYDECSLAATELNDLIVNESDLISFHCYLPRDQLTRVIAELQQNHRPMVCTEWLARSEGSTADLIDVFAEADVGAMNWGLVAGRTQTQFPWKSWWETVSDDEPWFHELLHPNGDPYDREEAAGLLRAARRKLRPS